MILIYTDNRFWNFTTVREKWKAFAIIYLTSHYDKLHSPFQKMASEFYEKNKYFFHKYIESERKFAGLPFKTMENLFSLFHSSGVESFLKYQLWTTILFTVFRTWLHSLHWFLFQHLFPKQLRTSLEHYYNTILNNFQNKSYSTVIRSDIVKSHWYMVPVTTMHPTSVLLEERHSLIFPLHQWYLESSPASMITKTVRKSKLFSIKLFPRTLGLSFTTDVNLIWLLFSEKSFRLIYLSIMFKNSHYKLY